MSIQRTVYISREDAIKKAIDTYVTQNMGVFHAEFNAMSNEELSSFIDEHFYNYLIQE